MCYAHNAQKNLTNQGECGILLLAKVTRACPPLCATRKTQRNREPSPVTYFLFDETRVKQISHMNMIFDEGDVGTTLLEILNQ